MRKCHALILIQKFNTLFWFVPKWSFLFRYDHDAIVEAMSRWAVSVGARKIVSDSNVHHDVADLNH
jgi:hypothetical protein